MDSSRQAGWENAAKVEIVDLTDREKKEIEFAQMYADQFNHGTSNSIGYLVINKLSKALGI